MLKKPNMLQALMYNLELYFTQLSKISNVSPYILRKILSGHKKGSTITWVKIYKGLNRCVFYES